VAVSPVSRRPTPGPHLPAGAPRGGVRRVGWGWLEWILLGQTALPALMFVPGLTALRPATRVASFAVSLLAWLALVAGGGRGPDPRGFPAAPWLKAVAAWMVLSILHPTTNSLAAGAAQAAMSLAVLAPAFWAPAALASHRQITRLMAILLACNAASALIGIAQFYYPNRFNPPVVATNGVSAEELSYETTDGRKVLRPCGLTDVPGGACGAGMIATVAGLGWSLRPLAPWKRLASLGLAVVGVAVICFSQTRSALITGVVMLLVFWALLMARRDWRKATLLGLGGGLVVVAALVWVTRVGGEALRERFRTLVTADPGNLYYRHRGFFVEDVFTRLIWDYPLGAGLGRWGQAYNYFGDPAAGPTAGALWAEVQWAGWALDGGIPLLVAYTTALAVALASSARIALRCRDEALAYWATVICAMSAGIVIQCFGYTPFISPGGVQFWILVAALHAADRRARAVGSRQSAVGRR
jgi:hypothetical protein